MTTGNRDELVDDLVRGLTGPNAGPLVLAGPARTGKTDLLSRTVGSLDRPDGPVVVAVRCHEPERDIAYALLDLVVRPVEAALERLHASQAVTLRGALGMATSGAPEPLAVGAALAALLGGAGRDDDRGLVLAVDDVHLADHASLGALGIALRRLDEGTGVLLTARDAVPEALAGVPSLDMSGMGGRDPVPPDEGPEAVGELLAGLPAAARTALLVVAAGDGMPLPAIESAMRACGVGPDDLSPAVDAGLLGAEGPELRPTVADTVWGQAPDARRREVLRALADGGVSPARRAWLLAGATLTTDDAVADQLSAVGMDALGRGAPAEAAAALTRAADLTVDPVIADRRRVLAGQMRVRAGQHGAASQLFAAVAAGDDPALASVANRGLGRLLTFSGQIAAAESHLRGHADRLTDRHPALAAALRAELVWPCSVDNRWGEGLEALRTAMPALAEPGLLERVALLAAETAVGLPVRSADLSSLGEELAGLDGRAPDLPLVGFLVLNSAILLEEDDVVDRASADLLRRGRTEGASGLLPLTLSCLADHLWGRGRWVEAMAAATEAASLAQELGEEVNAARARVVIARVCLQTTDRWEDGVRAVETELRSPIKWGRGAVLAAQGLGHLARGELDHAIGLLEEADALSVDPRFGRHHRRISCVGGDLVTALVADGQQARARALLADWAAGAGGSSPWARGVAARCRALLASGDEADRHADEAVALLAGAPFERARALLEQGEARQRAGRDDARGPLRRAFGQFSALGADLWATRASDGLGMRPEGVARSALSELTDQELRVATKVAEGLTNREAAAALFLSEKTVEGHLTRIYARLGLRSRVALTRLVLRHDQPAA